ncbi:alpha/beta fold hydrolase [Paraglaciecola aquimarina]|uniref:Alpha/beta fold hydrolase n=1 Tax=Paraglaciecola aquimarina TaxID=1235557 RepID=A0ABU3SWB3_9ALTE|nr:alpha/beta fold hydrolase [Paraglaciecola aquimarina]MDU0354310.1 alpha/beta fold hydrolase [Paraglaciecola aquimarina]
MKILVTVFLLTTVLTSAALIRGAAAQSVSSNLPEDASLSIDATLDKFDQLYQRELGSTRGCQQPELQMFKVCSDVLRNDGNGPFILHHNHVTDKVVVLFHGLSDSPFYLKSIAKALHQQGYNVVVGLLLGHGKKYADKDMQDRSLSSRWRQHVSELVQLSRHLGTKTDIGGFSTGGILAIEYALLNPQSVHALVLFSGALALNDSVETLSKVWGVQSLLKWYDGEYSTAGPNKYKYP